MCVNFTRAKIDEIHFELQILSIIVNAMIESLHVGIGNFLIRLPSLLLAVVRLATRNVC